MSPSHLHLPPAPPQRPRRARLRGRVAEVERRLADAIEWGSSTSALPAARRESTSPPSSASRRSHCARRCVGLRHPACGDAARAQRWDVRARPRTTGACSTVSVWTRSASTNCATWPTTGPPWRPPSRSWRPSGRQLRTYERLEEHVRAARRRVRARRTPGRRRALPRRAGSDHALAAAHARGDGPAGRGRAARLARRGPRSARSTITARCWTRSASGAPRRPRAHGRRTWRRARGGRRAAPSPPRTAIQRHVLDASAPPWRRSSRGRELRAVASNCPLRRTAPSSCRSATRSRDPRAVAACGRGRRGLRSRRRCGTRRAGWSGGGARGRAAGLPATPSWTRAAGLLRLRGRRVVHYAARHRHALDRRAVRGPQRHERAHPHAHHAGRARRAVPRSGRRGHRCRRSSRSRGRCWPRCRTPCCSTTAGASSPRTRPAGPWGCSGEATRPAPASSAIRESRGTS